MCWLRYHYISPSIPYYEEPLRVFDIAMSFGYPDSKSDWAIQEEIRLLDLFDSLVPGQDISQSAFLVSKLRKLAMRKDYIVSQAEGSLST